MRCRFLLGYTRCAVVGLLFAACGGDVSVGFNRAHQGGAAGSFPIAVATAGAGGVGVVRSTLVTQVAAGFNHTCARFADGRARCWGWNAFGQLGYGNATLSGTSPRARDRGDVPAGGSLQAIASGGFSNFTCGLLTSTSVRCWGENIANQLGYGNTTYLSDTQTPAAAGDLRLGDRRARQVALGAYCACLLFEGGQVRCWGATGRGQNGRGVVVPEDTARTETPASVPDVVLPQPATQIAMGPFHVCAVLQDGQVSCWGAGDFGQLGYGNTSDIGDNETPASVGTLALGAAAQAVGVGAFHSCALLVGGAVRCWGDGTGGTLGYGNTNNVGDRATPLAVGAVPLGGVAIRLAVGDTHNCVILEGGRVRCWGTGKGGRLGYGNEDDIGDNETPASLGRDVDVGGPAQSLALGDAHSCAVLQDGTMRCWGAADHGQLGYGNGNNIGDNETPASAGPVPVE